MIKALPVLKQLVATFESVQKKYAEFGARDTEPDGVFQECLVRAFKGKRAVPGSPEGWELYSDMKGAEEAADEMALTALACVDRILTAPISEAADIKGYLEGYCWRVSW